MENIQGGTLYNLDSRRLCAVRYGMKGQAYYLVVPKLTVEDIPPKVFLVPDALDENAVPTLLRLKCVAVEGGETSPIQIFEGYKVQPDRSAMVRNDIRIDLEVEVEIQVPSWSEGRTVKLKNISAGGLLFITKEPLDLGTVFSFELPLNGEQLFLVGEVLNKIPKGRGYIGHGCRILPLDASTETKIRSYIFQKLQHRSDEDQAR